MKHFLNSTLRLVLLSAIMLGSTTDLCADDNYSVINDHAILCNGIIYGLDYDGFNENAVANYAWVSGIPSDDREQCKAFSINSSVSYTIEWKERGPNGEIIKRQNTLHFRVTEISNEAFKASKLTSISIPNTITKIGGGAFENCENLQHVQLPSALKELGTDAFKGCTSLTKALLSNSMTEVPAGAFHGCKSLIDISIPSSVKVIGTSAFQGCSKLSDLDLGTVEEIGASAFSNCSNLNPIIIPASVKFIGVYAFTGCRPFNIVMRSGEPPHAQGAFGEECYTKSQLIVPFGTIDIYKKSNLGWSHFEHIVHSSY